MVDDNQEPKEIRIYQFGDEVLAECSSHYVFRGALAEVMVS